MILLVPRQAPHVVGWCAALYVAYGVASSGSGIGAGRLLFNGVVPPEQNTAYTAIYYAWMGLAGGLAPLLAGALDRRSTSRRSRARARRVPRRRQASVPGAAHAHEHGAPGDIGLGRA